MTDATAPLISAAYRFGEWRVEPELNRLSRDGEELQLETKTMDVLAYLVQHSERVVPAQELLEHVWTDRVVEQSTVHRRINQLRQALGDDSKRPRYIQTIAQRGFRAIAPVERVERVGDPVDPSRLARTTPPFEAYDGDEPYVFACYSHRNREAVYAELDRLRSAGHHIWYDEGIRPGSEWTADIAQAIRGCEHFAYFVTPDAVASEHCRRELHFAQSVRRPVTVIYLEPTELPDQLELQIGLTQAIHKYDIGSATYARKSEQAFKKATTRRLRPWRRLAGVAGAFVVIALGAWLWSARIAAPETPPVMAVLPFQTFGDGGDGQLFSAGFADTVLNRLTRVKELRVISPRASFRYTGSELDLREVGAALGADYLLEGSLRHAGGAIHISVRLIDAESATQVWSEVFHHAPDDMPRAEHQIAAQAARQVVSSLTPTPAPESRIESTAYDAYLRGLAYARTARWQAALPHYLEATRIDPDFADALAGAARAHSVVALTMEGEAAEKHWQEAARYANRALTLDPGSTEGRYAELLYKVTRENGDIQAFITGLEALIREVPSYTGALIAYAGHVKNMGRVAEIPAAVTRLKLLEPNSFSTFMVTYQYALTSGETDAARAVAEQFRTELGASHPGPPAWFFVAINAGLDGEVARELAQAGSLRPALELYIAWRNGRTVHPEELEMPEHLTLGRAWFAELFFGDTDAAMAILDNEARPPLVRDLRPAMAYWARFGNDREKRAARKWQRDPRYQAILAEQQLDDPTVETVVLDEQLFSADVAAID